MAIQLTRLHTYHILVCGHLNSVGSEKKNENFMSESTEISKRSGTMCTYTYEAL